MFAEGGELDMQGTPMAPDLSGNAADMADVLAEMQEAREPSCRYYKLLTC